jgi:antitoxin component of MazEF toxin-antitoxin module
MDFRKLRTMGGGESAGITLPKEDLRELGLVQDGEIVESYARVEHIEGSEFRVKLVE